MLDIKWIRENPEAFDAAMQNRNQQIRAGDLLKLDEEKRKIITQIQELQSERNSIVGQIAVLKKSGGNADELMEKSKVVNADIKRLEEGFGNDDELTNLLLQIPNIPDAQVVIGADENDNQEVEKWGELPHFDFVPKQHFEIGEGLNLLDFEQSSLMSGSRFSTLSGDLAKLERALSNFMLDVATQFGHIEISPPNLVKSEAMMRSGQLPKFAEEAFKTTNDYWLIPTSEVSLVNLVAQKTVDEKELPIRFTAYTPCFRSEAGAAGKDTRGLIRQHQFKKVELVSITTQEKSEQEHQHMTNIACEILRRLKLPYRKVLLCTGDMGFCSQKTYDLEVWLPGQNKYREISSCSNCGDFQARRLEAKYKTVNSKKPLLVHTLNGSALAVGRTIVAILENYQNADGSVNVPEALIGYMKGINKITKSML
ncbi:MAG: serine--tRNA ligase [Pseudomonadota bacterium]